MAGVRTVSRIVILLPPRIVSIIPWE